ncbi:translation initiation factor 4b [Niveomyces insectorum RCEF 264]|uniref:Translation initiation factor 4b n=1 Tax=Niveomyces insectorum RCEF 264 TaxID=1081102 RepID=A0A167Z4G0_9HYPO|nr:translation initiation factor 4b [Niveomyces insectorum RCEF 264]
MGDDSFGKSWADEVEETVGTQPLPALDRRFNSSFNSFGNDRGYAQRDSVPQRIPDKPPYLAHLGNLDYDIQEEDIRDLLSECEVTSIRLIEDRETKRPKGFGYAEFTTVDGLKKALSMDGTSFRGRSIKVKIADPPKERDRGESTRDLSEWTRKGPLPEPPSRSNDRRSGPSDYADRRPPRDLAGADDRRRDLTWERKGPLSPLPPPEPSADGAREGGRSRTNEGRSESFRGNRKTSPAAWGEGRSEAGTNNGSRPPRREFAERAERVPSAADRDMQWRTSMRPDAPVKSPAASRSGSEAPSSPAPAPAAPVVVARPKLNLAKRTVSEASETPSPVLASAGDAKASPFGAARPIDTATREREIEEKRIIALKEKKEADEKAKEEQRKAKEAAAQEAAAAKAAAEEAAKEAAKQEAAKAEAAKENAAKEEAATKPPAGESAQEPAAEAPVASAKEGSAEQPAEEKDAPKTDAAKTASQNGGAAHGPRTSRPREPKEQVQNPKSRATDSGNWRQPSGEQRGPRGPGNGPRRGSGAPRGPRNEGARHDGPRPPRANGGQNGPQSQPSTPKIPQEENGPSGPDEEGWETVPNKGRRSQKPRAA